MKNLSRIILSSYLILTADILSAADTIVSNSPTKTEPFIFTRFDNEQMKPLPDKLVFDSKKVALGQRLFNEKKLSHDNTISCASCHDFNRGGTDRLATSVGINGAKGEFNSPTVFNSGFNFVQFWDGRAASLEEQAAGPVHNPVEMGSNWDEVVTKLRNTEYVDLFSKLYEDDITPENIVDAIAIFERTLITPSRFDQYLRGEETLSEQEKGGFQRFKEYGCSSCHQGINIGGNMFQKLGGVKNYFANQKSSIADLGRFNVTGREEDRHVFKVPGLRNVAVTPPYFHNGSIKTLEEAVKIMGEAQLGRELSVQDIKLITSFLQSLTGQWQGQTLQ
ncbi:MAG: cytochrome-c peroxidase [gamma proteobacterium symbiont of Taylorina sp.]|nr:cytochrome-c peroxidase [gamma proteobacterium symbiont of Taylorina sp.]